jgi:hypothetical protein
MIELGCSPFRIKLLAFGKKVRRGSDKDATGHAYNRNQDSVVHVLSFQNP